MPVYKDMTFCTRKNCDFIQCPRHYAKVPWDDLPEWMGVSMSDMYGHERWCPVEKPPLEPPWKDMDAYKEEDEK